MKKNLVNICGAALLLAACASNQVKSETSYQAAYDSVEESASSPEAAVPSTIITAVTFKTQPTVMVLPAMGKSESASIDVIRKNPLAKSAMEVINGYMADKGYKVVGVESQNQLDEVVQLQNDIAGNVEDLAYVAGLSVGADINITFAGNFQDGNLVLNLNAVEASTAKLLASESVEMDGNQDNIQKLVQEAVKKAIVSLENKVRERIAADMELGVQYKVVGHLTADLTDENAENISNMISTKVRKRFNKMVITSMSRNTFDLTVFADPNVYEDAQMVYDVFVEEFGELAKIRKQNITKKLIILEIQ